MNVIESLASHTAEDPKESADRDRILAFARAHAQPFDRAIVSGHLTGSGLVMSPDGGLVLLLHHLKLHRWLQPGGHGEPGEQTGEEVAAREVREETGLEPRLHPAAPRPFDVDIHVIPARKADPAHEHLDLRYLFIAEPHEALREEPPEETGAHQGPRLAWFPVDEALAMDLDPGLLRMIRKARRFLSRG